MPYIVRPMSPSLVDAALSPELLKEARFRPTGQPRHLEWGPPRAERNPAKHEGRAGASSGPAPISGSFMMGLNSGYPPDEKFEPDPVIQEAAAILPNGGSAVLQFGWFLGKPEKSLRFTIENSPGEDAGGKPTAAPSDDEFVARFSKLVEHLAAKYRQREIWYDFQRGTERVGEPKKLLWSPD